MGRIKNCAPCIHYRTLFKYFDKKYHCECSMGVSLDVADEPKTVNTSGYDSITFYTKPLNGDCKYKYMKRKEWLEAKIKIENVCHIYFNKKDLTDILRIYPKNSLYKNTPNY